jgi:mRNA interferase MazF
MAVKRGDVVLVHVKFSSGLGGKVRPALVVQSDANHLRLQDTIVALITRTTKNVHEPTQLLIDVGTPDGRQTGLLQTSAVKCEHLETVLQADIRRIVGALSIPMMQQIDVCLKVALELT